MADNQLNIEETARSATQTAHTVLDGVASPEDVRNMDMAQLETLCSDIRTKLVETVSKTGGHLSSNLGVVELTVALHKSFSLPHDQIVWDVGHQCYVHKLLTGRKEQFDTIRQEGGLSGFPRPEESEYDTFIVGHSSTAVSAANGLAKAKALTGDDGFVVAVLGDGALTGGLAYEGLSNAGRSSDRLIVVLNDNRMSISRNVGFVARHLSTLRSRVRYIRFKNRFSKVMAHIPWIGLPIYNFLLRIKTKLKNMMYNNSSLFEEMGFYYLGPIDGHDLNDLIKAMETAKDIHRPVLLHVETVKGRGYSYAMKSPDLYHGVTGFDVETGKTIAGGPCFSSVFGSMICQLAKENEKICAITAAMKSGTCLQQFAEEFPERFFDVGIAEGHAVTFASGLAQNGLLPVFAVYSTFLQRSYDQILNDTSIINGHIVLAIDRAGIVPDDGETHQGIFDVPFLTTIPHVTIYSPSCFKELEMRLKQAVYDVPGIAAVRYPKGNECSRPDFEPDYKPYTLYQSTGARILLITYGRIFYHALDAAEQLLEQGIRVSVLKLNRIYPIETECVTLAMGYTRVFFFEESSRSGSIAEHFGTLLMEHRYFGVYEIHAIDAFIPACSTESGLHKAGLDTEGMMAAIQKTLDGGFRIDYGNKGE